MLKFTFFNVLEKLLIATAFFYLAFTNQSIYNLVESEVAISAIFITVLDLGFGSYPLYLKGLHSKIVALEWLESVKTAYIFILILLIVFAGLFDYNIWLSRSSVLCALLLLKTTHRIEDNLMQYFKVSLVYSLGILIFVFYPKLNFTSFSVAHYVLSLFTLALVISKVGLSKIQLNPLTKSLKYSWPLMFQSFVYVGLFNVQRILISSVNDFRLSEVNFNLRLSGFFLLAFSSMIFYDNHVHYDKETSNRVSLLLFLKRLMLLLFGSAMLMICWKLFPLKYGVTIHYFYWIPLSILAYQELLLAKNDRNIHNLISALICLFTYVILSQLSSAEPSGLFLWACLISIVYRVLFIYNGKG